MKHCILFFLCCFQLSFAQIVLENDHTLQFNESLLDSIDPNNTLTLDEYLSFVKEFHPIVKQANLVIDESNFKRLKSRGAFDPKLEVDYASKNFKGTDYYDKLNATFKVPVWYGIGVKGSFEKNQGIYLNPEATTPDDGLFGLGVTANIGKGMLMNERMAAIKQAENYQKQAIEEQKILVNKIIFDAANAYFNWLQYYGEKEIRLSFLKNATDRFKAIRQSFYSGEMAAVDTLEANITVLNRKLELEQAQVKYVKSTLELSNFLWLKDNVPVELQPQMEPDILTIVKVDMSLQTSLQAIDSFDIAQHPKLKALQIKTENLKIERKLSSNNLMPEINAEYNFLSNNYNSNYITDNTKAGIKVSIPILLRKERADMKLAKVKIQSMEYEQFNEKTNIENAVNALLNELESYERQLEYSEILVNDYGRLSKAELRKFSLGESSIFYVNIRESKQIEAQLKFVKLVNDYLKTKAKLFNKLVLN